MSASWLPTAGGIVPPIEPADADRDEGRYTAFSRKLEDARSEYAARRFETAQRMLDELISSRKTPRQQTSSACGLLLASALTLRARVCWRMAEREREKQNAAGERRARKRQIAAFRQAAKAFEGFRDALKDHPTESRLRTDFGIALYRNGEAAAAVESLQSALRTGVAPVETFAYLGMALCDLGEHAEATRALTKGFQIAPRDKVLLETMAINYESEWRDAQRRGDAEAERAKAELAIQKYCQTAVEAGRAEALNEASDFLAAALKIAPDDARPLSMLCLLLRSQGKSAEAWALLAQTLQDFPGHPWALGLRGLLNADQGKTDEALADFGTARVDRPELVWVTLEHAKALAGHDAKAARRLLARATKWLEGADPRLIQARNEINVSNAIATTGTAFRVGKRIVSWLASSERVAPVTDRVTTYIERALGASIGDPLEFLKQLAKTLPNRVEPLEALAREHMKQENWAAASDVVSEALEREPESATLLSLKADALDKLEQPLEALRFRQRGVRLAPHDEAAFDAYLKALTDLGRTDDALRELDSRLQLTPDYGRGWMEKGRLLLKTRQYHESAGAFRRAEALYPEDGKQTLEIRIRLSEALKGANRYANAGEALARAVKHDNEAGDARAHTALLLLDIADYAAAAELLRASIDSLPERSEERRAWCMNTRGWALYCDGVTKLPELEAIFKLACSNARFAPFARKNLAQTLLRMPGREKEGEEILSELTEMSVNRWPLDLVGWCHFRLHRFDAAEQWLRASVRDDPDNAAATGFDLALLLLAKQSPDAAAEYAAVRMRAVSFDRLRQRGLFHIAAQDTKEALEDGLLPAKEGHKRLDDLINRLAGLGFEPQRLERLMLPRRKSLGAA